MSAGGRHRDDCSASPPPSTFQMLEVTVISAQDLHRRFGRRVRAYAVAWADDAHKLRTDVDLAGGADPTWNDRFLFRVDDEFLQSDTAAVTVEVRAARRLLGGDAVLGVTRIVVSTFVGPSGLTSSSTRGTTGRQVASLQLRRPRSLRPQGIVNVAVALLDATDARAVPLCSAPDSPDAFSVKDLVVKRPGSLARIAEVDEAEEADDPAALVEHSGPLDPRGSAVEQRKLELTLEKWKADLSPDQKGSCCRSGSRRQRRRSSCFRGGAEWER
ncbi:hypothetical protein E2562_018514 [Oryza meyeriana var. granulata]|uniref:C2 domain-containing protein n=1 Tax=Oryza meyeriana var. granulata TaxID=110450 RepID=A0A6G1F923_9ORYZ|nr:hypothetical protein E2562_018514 [Oryza meyeriana var. granulata]